MDLYLLPKHIILYQIYDCLKDKYLLYILKQYAIYVIFVPNIYI